MKSGEHDDIASIIGTNYSFFWVIDQDRNVVARFSFTPTPEPFDSPSTALRWIEGVKTNLATFDASKKAYKADPDNIENATKLALSCFALGRFDDYLSTTKNILPFLQEHVRPDFRIRQVYAAYMTCDPNAGVLFHALANELFEAKDERVIDLLCRVMSLNAFTEAVDAVTPSPTVKYLERMLDMFPKHERTGACLVAVIGTARWTAGRNDFDRLIEQFERSAGKMDPQVKKLKEMIRETNSIFDGFAKMNPDNSNETPGNKEVPDGQEQANPRPSDSKEMEF